MKYSIEWSAEAEYTFKEIVLYLEENWTSKEIRNVIARTETVLSFIEKNPLIYPLSEKQEIRRVVINRQVSLYFEIFDGKVMLLSFRDNRQNPRNK